ncbi:hypothetical protein V4D30_00815 [Thermodesulfovibrio sp. 3907-1M]|uniref:Uncharacterized protein n=1 Tax=Thermodesulfovibrio autotrophicus TaxID=3118333 RepID=A0AAU8GZL6_9BACT
MSKTMGSKRKKSKKNNKENLKQEKQSLKFFLSKGFTLNLPYESKEIAKKAGFKYFPDLKVWMTWDYKKAYQVFSNEPEIKISKQLSNFFNFWKENLWKNVRVIRKAIFYLKEKCDFAQMKDRHGFSTVDKKTGWELARKTKWDKKDLVQAAWIVYTHRKQVKHIIR